MPKICIVTDIHHGADQVTKKGTAAARLMAKFAAFCADEAPDLVLDLGDRISDVDRDSDLGLERDAAGMFAPIMQPVHHFCGNHDRDHLSVQDNEQILSTPLRNETLDIGGWTLVLFRADARLHRDGHELSFALPESDLLWLAGVVSTATQPLAIFSHVPLSGHDQTGNYYFQNNPGYAHYPETPRIRAVLAMARVPVVCMAGHVHWNALTTVDGIPHLTQQSLTETFTTHPQPAGAMGVLDLGERDINWTVHGLDPVQMRLSVEPAGRRWITPLPPVARQRRFAQTSPSDE